MKPFTGWRVESRSRRRTFLLCHFTSIIYTAVISYEVRTTKKPSSKESRDLVVMHHRHYIYLLQSRATFHYAPVYDERHHHNQIFVYSTSPCTVNLMNPSDCLGQYPPRAPVPLVDVL